MLNEVLFSTIDKYMVGTSGSQLYELDPELYAKTCNRLSDNINWFEVGNYHMILVIRPLDTGKDAISTKFYKFRISDALLKYIKTAPAKAYRSITISGDPAVISVTLHRITEITDSKDLQVLIDEAKKAGKIYH
jgi:hypothetical protein